MLSLVFLIFVHPNNVSCFYIFGWSIPTWMMIQSPGCWFIAHIAHICGFHGWWLCTFPARIRFQPHISKSKESVYGFLQGQYVPPSIQPAIYVHTNSQPRHWWLGLGVTIPKWHKWSYFYFTNLLQVIWCKLQVILPNLPTYFPSFQVGKLWHHFSRWDSYMDYRHPTLGLKLVTINPYYRGEGDYPLL